MRPLLDSITVVLAWTAGATTLIVLGIRLLWRRGMNLED